MKPAFAIAATLAALSATAVAAGTLPIRPGDYVQADTPCRDAPFAAMASFDGRGLGGPHAAQCRSTILSRTGTRYRVRTTCLANGDGSPATPSTIDQTIRILSPSRFAVLSQAGATVFRRCATIE